MTTFVLATIALVAAVLIGMARSSARAMRQEPSNAAVRREGDRRTGTEESRHDYGGQPQPASTHPASTQPAGSR